jgi:branched-subunit amino acid ABC-type transport system permease component
VDLVTLLQQLINALSLGSLYALIAIGYTMVYGILRLINFAHGDLLMVAAYAAVMGVGIFAWPWPPCWSGRSLPSSPASISRVSPSCWWSRTPPRP